MADPRAEERYLQSLAASRPSYGASGTAPDAPEEEPAYLKLPPPQAYSGAGGAPPAPGEVLPEPDMSYYEEPDPDVFRARFYGDASAASSDPDPALTRSERAQWQQARAGGPMAPPTAPPRGGGGPPPLPPEMAGKYGGRYFGPDFVARLLGDAEHLEDFPPEKQAQITRALGAYQEQQNSIRGLQEQQARTGVRAGDAYTQLMRQSAMDQQRQAGEEAARAAQMADHERQQREAAALRLQTRERVEGVIKGQIAAADKRAADYRIRDRRDTGTRFAHMIAAALGTIGQGLAGLPNHAMEEISKGIDRDIGSQEKELEGIQLEAGRKRNDLAAYAEEFGDKERARGALEASYYRQMAQSAAMSKSQAGSRAARSVYDYLEKEGNLRAQQAELQIAETAAMDEYAAKQAAMRAAQQQQATGPVVTGDVDDAQAGLYVPGAGIFAHNKADKEKIAAAYAFKSSMDAITKEMEGVLNQASTEEMDWTVANTQLNHLNLARQNAISQATGSGVITAGEGARYDAAMPSGTEWNKTEAQARAGLQVSRGLADNAARSEIRARGGTPGWMETYTDKKGKLRKRGYIVAPTADRQTEAREAATRAAGYE